MAVKSEYYDDVSDFIHQISFGWTARKFHKGNGVLFACSQKAQWKPPPMPEKFYCKVRGSPDALWQRDC